LGFWLVCHFAETPVLGTRYQGPWFFDYVVSWLEFGPWFAWLGLDWLRRKTFHGLESA
jgi:hypothetical protein